MKKLHLSNKVKKKILASLMVIVVFATSFLSDWFVPQTKASSVTSQTAIQKDLVADGEPGIVISGIGATKTLMWLTTFDGTYYKSVYCLQHGKHFQSKQTLTADNLNTLLDEIGYNKTQKITLSYILYYGYNRTGESKLGNVYCDFSKTTVDGKYKSATYNNSTRSSVEYMGTQLLVWLLTKDVELKRKVFGTTSQRAEYQTMLNNAISDIKACIPNNLISVDGEEVRAQTYFAKYTKTLYEKVLEAQFCKTPNFSTKNNTVAVTQVGEGVDLKKAIDTSLKNPVTLKWDSSQNRYVATLTDSSYKALSHFVSGNNFYKKAYYNKNGDKKSVSGISYTFGKSKSTNSLKDVLTIKVKEPITSDTVLYAETNETIWTCDVKDTSSAYVVWSFGNSSYQPVTEGKLNTDPVKITMAIKTPETTATINIDKTDVKTGKSIEGVVFRVYKYDNTLETPKYVDTGKTYKTDANGKVSFKVSIGASNGGKFRVYEESNPDSYYLSPNLCVFDSSDVLSKSTGKNKVLEPGDVVDLEPTNTPYTANVTAIKQGKYLSGLDSNGNFTYSDVKIKLSGAKIGIYSDAACTKPVTKDYAGNTISSTGITNEEGKFQWKGLKPNIYYLKELSSPTGYNLATNVIKVDVTLNSTVAEFNNSTISKGGWITDAITTFTQNVIKKDAENGQTVEGIQFTLYSSWTMYDKDGKKIVGANTPIKSAYTDANGKISFTNLPAYAYDKNGKYTNWKSLFYVKETGRKAGTEGAKYVINTASKLTCNGGTLNVSNPQIKGTVTIVKTGSTLSSFAGVNKGFKFDSVKSLAGVKFDIIALEDIKDPQGNLKHKKNDVVATITTDANGKATTTALYLGKYGVKEVSTGADYVLDTKTYNFTLSATSDNPSATVQVNNLLHELRIGILKKDSDKTRPVPNTEFSIYAAEDIKNAAGNVIVKKNSLVATGLSDASGYITIPNLAKAKYYAKETKAAPGFALDSTRIEFTAPYKKDAVVYKEVYNTQISASLEVIKTGKELTSFEDGKFAFNTDKPLEGVVFSLFAKEEIKDALGNHIYDKDEKVATGTTDKNGKILFENLPQGLFILKEEYVPEGHIISKESYEINLTTKDSSKLTFTVKQTVSNDYDCGEVVVTKKDEDTLEPLADCKLGLYAAEDIKNAGGKIIVKKDQLITSALSDAEGKITFGNLPHAQYYVKEIEPCEGYKLSDVKVSTGEVFIESVEVEYLNDKMDAKLTVYKTGDEISAVGGNNKAFKFDAQIPLKGVEFNLYAAEDIYDALGEKQFSAGDTVATLKTNKDGKAVNTNLYPGKYKLVETVTNNDYFIDDTEYMVDLTYSDGTSVPQQIVNVTNTHKKYFINLVKANDYTGEGLQGSVYGIYANEDIKNKAGVVIAPKDTLVAKGTTDANGKVLFSDLDEAEYYVQEISAPSGFNVSPVKYPITKDQLALLVDETTEDFPVYDTNIDGTGTIEAVDGGVNITVTDVPIEVEFDKIDVVTGNLLPGCILEIYTADGKLYDSFTTTEKSYKISAMPAGQYILKEVGTIEGYTLAKDMKFTVKQEGGVQKVTMVNERVLFNFTVEKLDELTKEPLKGAEFEIKNSAGEVVDTIVTNEKGIATSKDLEMCYYDANGIFIEKAIYFVQETKCPNHLVTDDVYEVSFSDEDIKEPMIKITQTVYNYPIAEVHITKLGNGGIKLADATFGVYDENDNLVAQITTDKTGVAIFKEAMLEKVYTYKELSAPEGYALNTDTFSFVAHTDGTVEGNLTVTDEQARVSISKVDTDTLESLAGAEFTIYDMDGNEIAKAISDEWGYADFVGLQWGLYEIRETDAPYGYDISGEVITVEITSNYVNADPILMKNSKTVQTGVEEQQEPLKDNLIKLAVLTLMVGLMLIALIIVPLATKPRKRY